jgi:hypothetical protein
LGPLWTLPCKTKPNVSSQNANAVLHRYTGHGQWSIYERQKEGTLHNNYRPKQLIYIDLNASFELLRKDRPHKPVIIPLGNGVKINNYIDGTYAAKRYQLMVRGGVLMRNSTVTLKSVPAAADWGGSNKYYTNMISTSIYAGLSINKM